MKKLATSLALICSGVIATSAAQAAQTSHFRSSASSLIASFNSFASPCQALSTDILFGSQVIQSLGAPMRGPNLVVEVRYVDFCNPDAPIDMTFDGFTDTVESTIRGDLGAATLVAQLPVTDASGNTVLLSINLAFTATGDVATSRDTFHTNDNGTVVNIRFSSSSRPATATGTISGSFPTSSGPQTLNGAATSSLSASIGNNLNGDVVVIKK
ncbi:MAG TPA: hypothetical protein VNO55_04125 [Polyangia bacterium]|nr:hypothetical protein [Polyangia bacterium]